MRLTVTLISPDKKEMEIEVLVKHGASALDVAAALDDGEFPYCQKITLYNSKLAWNDEILPHAPLVVWLSEELQVKVSWLDNLKTAEDDRKRLLTQTLRKIIDGHFVKATRDQGETARNNAKEKQKETIFEAAERGKKLTEALFRERHQRELILRVSRGFDDHLRQRYKALAEFFIAVGIGEVTHDQLKTVVDNIWMVRKELIEIKVVTPSGWNVPGWEALCAAILASRNLNILESGAGDSNDVTAQLNQLIRGETLPGTDEVQASGQMVFLARPPEGITRPDLDGIAAALEREIISQSRQKWPDMTENPQVQVIPPETLKLL